MEQKLSSMKQEHIFSAKILHTLYSMFIPGLFLIVFSQLMDLLFNGMLGINGFTFLFIFLVMGEEEFTGSILYKEKVDEIERLREILLIFIFIIGGRLLFTDGTWAVKLNSIRSVSFITLCIIVVVQWFNSFAIHLDLRQREIFLQSLGHHAGSRLVESIRKNVLQFDISQTKIAKTKTKVILFQVLCIAGLGVLYIAKKPVPPLLTGLNILHMLSGCLFLISLNRILDENNLLCEGVRPGAYFQRKHTYYLFFMILLSTGIALLSARNVSLLPVTIFFPLLNWFLNALKIKHVAIPPSAPPTPNPDFFNPGHILDKIAPAGGNNSILQILHTIMVIFAWIILFALVAGFLFFLFSPFFSPYFRFKIRNIIPFQLIGKLFGKLIRGIRHIWKDFNNWLNHDNEEIIEKENRERVPEKILEIKETKKFKLSKRIQVRSFIKAFIKLTYWGASKKHLAYEKYMGPMEYGRQLMLTAPEQADHIRTVLEIFEEGLYSRHLVEKEKVTLYYKLVQEIINSI